MVQVKDAAREGLGQEPAQAEATKVKKPRRKRTKADAAEPSKRSKGGDTEKGNQDEKTKSEKGNEDEKTKSAGSGSKPEKTNNKQDDGQEPVNKEPSTSSRGKHSSEEVLAAWKIQELCLTKLFKSGNVRYNIYIYIKQRLFSLSVCLPARSQCCVVPASLCLMDLQGTRRALRLRARIKRRLVCCRAPTKTLKCF